MAKKILKKAQDGSSVNAVRPLKPGGKSPAAQRFAGQRPTVNPMPKSTVSRYELNQQRIKRQSAQSTDESTLLPKNKMGGMMKKAQGGIALKKIAEADPKNALNKNDLRTPPTRVMENVNVYAPKLKADSTSAGSKKKMGGMIKRADGSYSKRGLWDNIRANKGSGKKPTAAMLKQEKKIKAQTKKK